MKHQDRFNSYQYGEGRTGIGQLVEFSCPPEVTKKVSDFLLKNVRTIDAPTTGHVNITHGGYSQYTRYDIVQHKYAGGGYGRNGGYVEVLEIKNPPNGRWGVVINKHTGYAGGEFTEWETLDNALEAFEKFWGSDKTDEEFPKLPGFKRSVNCGALVPWFYAIGDEELIGDYAFPDGLQDDPVYRFGRKFLVCGYREVPMVKTCMGARFVEGETEYPPHDKVQYRLVYWDDGSVWDERKSYDGLPRPLEEGEMWITEAVQQFKKLLAGETTNFTINFTDGNKFVGKLVKTKKNSSCAEGDYLLAIKFKGDKESVEGWVNNFKPTKDAPNIIQYVTDRYNEEGNEIELIEIKKCKTKKGGKKWSGAFFNVPH